MKTIEEMSAEEIEAEIEQRVGHRMEYAQLGPNVLPLYMDWNLSKEAHVKLMGADEDECRRKLLTHLRERAVGDANTGT